MLYIELHVRWPEQFDVPQSIARIPYNYGDKICEPSHLPCNPIPALSVYILSSQQPASTFSLFFPVLSLPVCARRGRTHAMRSVNSFSTPTHPNPAFVLLVKFYSTYCVLLQQSHEDATSHYTQLHQVSQKCSIVKFCTLRLYALRRGSGSLERLHTCIVSGVL